jgi:hypothetical protein
MGDMRMNVKIREWLLKVIEKTNSNDVVWVFNGDFYEVVLKTNDRITVNSVPLSVGAPQMRYILEINSKTLPGVVNPWDEDMGYEVWFAVYNAAKENVYANRIQESVQAELNKGEST